MLDLYEDEFEDAPRQTKMRRNRDRDYADERHDKANKPVRRDKWATVGSTE